MARAPILAFIVVFLSARDMEANRLTDEVVQEMRSERQKLVRDIEAVSDNHKREGKGFTEVRTLLHKFYSLVAKKQGGEQRLYDGEAVQNALPQFDDGTELSKNRNIAADLFENDMVLTLEQVQALVDKVDTGARDTKRKRRKLISNLAIRWPGAKFPYRFAVEDSSWQDVIRSAIAHWEAESCVRFEENGVGDDYVRFFVGDGCYSSVGRTGGAQQISIGNGCELMAIVAHEIGHTLGFWHEQSRPDRDDYISVKAGNMIAGTQGQVEKRSPSQLNDYGVPYDVGSAMHYGPKAFASDQSLYTLETNDPKYKNTIGQRARLSFIDVKQINKAYCADKCTTNLGCQNNGYENPNKCTECKCPEGLGGKVCTDLQPSNCGKDLTATNEWQTLSSSDSGMCYWRIKSNGGNVRFEVTSVSYDCQDTCVSYLEIKFNGNVQQTGYRLCCEATGGEIVSKDDYILVMAKGSNGGSFELRYKSEGGSGGGGSAGTTPSSVTGGTTATAAATPRGRATPSPGTATPTPGVTPTPTATDATTQRKKNNQESTDPPTPTAMQTPAGTATPTPTPTPTTERTRKHHHHHTTTRKHHHHHHTTPETTPDDSRKKKRRHLLHTTPLPTTTIHSRAHRHRHHVKHTTTMPDY